MDTTAQRPALTAPPGAQPALRLLFCGEANIVTRPPQLLSRGPTAIGRDPAGAGAGAGILLAEDRQVSRRHATVVVDGQGVRLVDEGSRNGSFVNGHPVSGEGCQLSDGDVLCIGDSFLLFRHEPVLSRDA